jgi:enoyl-CoA hydratase/carnithine racemase
MSEHVVTETTGGVLTLAMYAAAAAALKAADKDPAVRVVIIIGTADSFAAGNDLKDFLENPPTTPDAPVFQFMNTLATFPKPVIAAVNGVAVGIGTTMLLHCDLAYAVPTAKFQLPFVSLAIVPEYASTLLVPRMVGPARAAELLLLGEAFTAERALEVGFINAIVPADQLLSHAMAKAAILKAKPPAALRAAKALLRADQKDIAARIQMENEVVRGRLQSAEFKEAATAFFEKRAPDFSKFS